MIVDETTHHQSQNDVDVSNYLQVKHVLLALNPLLTWDSN